MNERIKELRKDQKLTLKKFGERLGVSEGAISNLEKGNRNITDQMFKSICREFNVNENWLRNGEGEMYIKNNTFNLNEYATSKGATPLEIELIKSYLNIPKEIRETVLNAFKETLSSKSRPTLLKEETGQMTYNFDNSQKADNDESKDKTVEELEEEYKKSRLHSVQNISSSALSITDEKEKKKNA